MYKMYGLSFFRETRTSTELTGLASQARRTLPALAEPVLAVRAHVGPLPGVRHAVVLEGVERPELELAEVAGQRLLAVRLHVVLQVRLDLGDHP